MAEPHDPDHHEPITVSTNQARAGSTPHVVRYILVISTILAIVGMGLIWALGHP